MLSKEERSLCSVISWSLPRVSGSCEAAHEGAGHMWQFYHPGPCPVGSRVGEPSAVTAF